MRKLKTIFTAIICAALFCTQSASAQEHHHGHSHSRNEIGISVGPLYGIDDDEWGFGVHLHYFRTLGDHSRWAVGAFAEQAWLCGDHFSLGAGARYSIFDRLHLAVMPGATFARHKHGHDHGHDHDRGDGDHDFGTKIRFALHTEMAYDLFRWNRFHLSPVIDYSWSENDSHFMIGLHGAFCF